MCLCLRGPIEKRESVWGEEVRRQRGEDGGRERGGLVLSSAMLW